MCWTDTPRVICDYADLQRQAGAQGKGVTQNKGRDGGLQSALADPREESVLLRESGF